MMARYNDPTQGPDGCLVLLGIAGILVVYIGVVVLLFRLFGL